MLKAGDRVANEDQSDPRLGPIFRDILIFSFATSLPAFDFAFFGWLAGCLPLLTFVLLFSYGMHVGNRMILVGVFMALVAGVAFARFEPLMISIAMLPSGYMLAQSALHHESPARSGLKGTVALATCWLLMIGAFAIFYGINPYTGFLRSLDQGISEALELYRQSASINDETRAVLESSLNQMKTVLPLILPSVLAGIALSTIWFAMAAGGRLAVVLAGKAPWPQQHLWKLPDRLVWLPIVAALLTLLPGEQLKVVSINILVVGCVVYWFQGLAVFSFLLHKWKMPRPFRAFLYVIVVFQSFGAVILFGTGLADVWLDFRKIRGSAETDSVLTS
jgi:uncharacterized protein YybS (DUF2232 family)